MENKQPNQTIEFRSPLVQREPDDEIAKRALSLPRWKIRYNAIWVNVEKGHRLSRERSVGIWTGKQPSTWYAG